MRGHRAVVGVVALLAVVASAPGTLAGGEDGCSSVTVDTIVYSSTTVCTGEDGVPDPPDPEDPTVPDPGGPSVPDVADPVLQALEDVKDERDQLRDEAKGEMNASVEGCEGAWRTGLELDQNGTETYLCVNVGYDHGDGSIFDALETPEYDGCPDEEGFGLTLRDPTTDTVVGVCMIFDVLIPTRNFDHVEWDLEDCSFQSVPDGSDPRVQIGNGGVVVCASVFTDPGTAPEADVDIEECPNGADPAVHIGDWHVAVCVEHAVRE